MSQLPTVDADKTILEICESVAQGNISVSDGLNYIEERLKPTLADHKDTNKITVLAILTVHQLIPRSEGVFLTDEQLHEMWNNKREVIDQHPAMQMSFLVLSCMQLTCIGAMRNGAKAMGQTLDRLLPDEARDSQADLN